MNNTFNINRFGLLLKRQWLEFGKIYLITLLVVLGTIVGFYSLNLLFEVRELSVRDLSFREPFFIIFGALFITVIASNYFAPLGQKSRAVIDLMLPASVFEKFLSGVLFTSVLSTLSFIVIFFAVDFAFVSTLRENFGAEELKNVPYIFSKDYHEAMYMLLAMPFLVTSVFLLGSIYFNRFHYIKTVVTVMIFGAIWSYLIVKVTKKLITTGKVNESAATGTNSNSIFLFVSITALITLVFWIITYVRLKEKEV